MKCAFGLKPLLRIGASQLFCEPICEAPGLEETFNTSTLLDKQVSPIKYPEDRVLR